jgi:hypothetical protein
MLNLKFFLFFIQRVNVSVFRIDKDYERTKSNLASQRDKIDDTYKREIEQHVARKTDLNRQLEDMQNKLKVLLA